jgi:succinate-semialdehyde dehydrogenase/glutarate-semialdehyde dehydrogenase
LQAWKITPAQTRAKILTNLGTYLLDMREQLAAIISAEQGKPIKEALGEVQYSAQYMQCYAEEALRITPEAIEDDDSPKHLEVQSKPLGVVAAITPWNFPLAMLARKMAAALAAGCTFIAKPAPETPLSALALGEACCSAKVPTDVVQIVTGDAHTIGRAFMQSKIVRGVSFTGSTTTGKLLIEQSSSTVKKLTLELGGNAPCIICKDANIEKAVQGILLGKFRNAGQVCIAINRLLVHEDIAPEISRKLAHAVSQLKTYENETTPYDIGPLITQAAVHKVASLVTEALNQGATLAYGTIPATNTDSTLVKPCILSGITSSMAIWDEEIFGPILSMTTFSDTDEAIALANDTDYGLASYVYSSDIEAARALAQQLDFGMVGINDTAISNARAPFGGVKQSGFGREGGRYGIAEYMELQYQCISG